MLGQAHVFSPMYPRFAALGCKGGDSSCRKGNHGDEELRGPSEGGPYPVVNRLVMGVSFAPVHRHNRDPQLGQTCPAAPPAPDPTLNCQRDARGNAVCSNGMRFPPGCPHTPPEEYFSPGIAPDEIHGGIVEARIPPPRQGGAVGVPGAGPSAGAALVVPVVAVGGIAAVAAFFLLR